MRKKSFSFECKKQRTRSSLGIITTSKTWCDSAYRKNQDNCARAVLQLSLSVATLPVIHCQHTRFLVLGQVVSEEHEHDRSIVHDHLTNLSLHRSKCRVLTTLSSPCLGFVFEFVYQSRSSNNGHVPSSVFDGAGL